MLASALQLAGACEKEKASADTPSIGLAAALFVAFSPDKVIDALSLNDGAVLTQNPFRAKIRGNKKLAKSGFMAKS